VQELQRTGARLSLAYLTAYLRSETGQPRTAPPVDLAGYVGTLTHRQAARRGARAVAVHGEGRDQGRGGGPGGALKLGLDRAARVTGEETIAAARAALADGIRQDGRIIGWRRVTGGGCGACIAAATGAIQADDELLEVHDHCQCSKEPVVADVPDDTHRPTGPAMFRAMPAHEQDALLGPEKADLLRTGAIGFHDLIKRDPMAVLPDGISEAPLSALTTSP
jgi:hypothetical protein